MDRLIDRRFTGAMQRLLSSVLLVSAVGTGVLGGVFFAFTFVLNGLSRLGPPEGVAGMQAIDRAIVSPPFLLVFVGMGVTCAGLVVSACFRWGEPGATYQLLGGAA